MVDKIIILSQAPLTPQIRRNTYVEDIKYMGYDVEFWDISQILHKGLKLSDNIETIYLVKFTNIHQLESKLKSTVNKSTAFLIDFDPDWNNRQVFKLLFKNDCYCIRVDMYANTCLSESFGERIKTIFSKNGHKLIINKLRYLSFKFYMKLEMPFKFKRILSSSVYSNRTDAINHPDYEEFKNDTDSLPKELELLQNNYIVFIDTFFGRHPDLQYIYHENNINIDKYYASLTSFFDYLERHYNIEVVIAAHPKADYDADEFGSRKIIKYQTFHLIKYAKFVIVQVCNTFSWLTLLNKSVALISTNGYVKVPHIKRAINNLSRTFNLKIQNIDRIPFEDIQFSKINENLRKSYIYSYLTNSKTETTNNIKILDELFSSI